MENACLAFGSSELVGGKVKTKQARIIKNSFFNVLEQWEKLCYPDCLIDNPFFLSPTYLMHTETDMCTHTQHKDSFGFNW